MFAALALSFAVIFVAELGDKSQLMAMTFALRYRWWVVLTAILTATTLVHAASVFLGHFLGLSIPTELMSIVGGLSMLVFGLWTVRGDELDDDEASRAGRVGRSVFFAVMSSFLLAELGDKTMLATIALAADHDWLGVWIGSTVGMVAADALAIIVGRTLGRHLPERTIALGAAVLFFGFAVWLIVEGLTGASALVAALTIVGALVITALGVVWIISTNRRRAAEAAARAEIDETAEGVTQIAK
ncbi:TMEM165/GDT1 family protein [Gordonia sp. PDNC005]|uniref:TMEM165/GDT1 family protein n=1 Tax=unclassified Gordonia (in: high G+C Gram-positive bacteria) TaxID=2657482 RepID=UPI0019623EC0|nr:TMEM165/GDT1 family protein [Gordonia sp. PDNC005]QRY62442.1 TMEM165/GDT1 family protein [Gordonia sp. PDNC005]